MAPISTLLLLALFFLCLFANAPFVPSNKCPNLLDGQMLDFANSGGIRLHNSMSMGCPHMLSCDIVSAPAETIIEWLYNGETIRTTSSGELGYLFGMNEGKSQLGLSETSHRFCISELFTRQGGKRAIGTDGDVSCRVRLGCDASKVVESEPFKLATLAPLLPLRRGERQAPGIRRLPSGRKNPSIYMVTSSRMELAGHVIQLVCRSDGEPKPRNEWAVIGIDGVKLTNEQSIKGYSFIIELNNGDLIVDTSMTENASLTLRCRATNAFGEDSATSTIILLKE